MKENRRRRSVALIAGVLLTVAGVVIVLVSLVGSTATASFGWFAYAPLANAVFVPGDLLMLSRITLLGVVLLLVGLLAVSFLVGLHVGSRRRADESPR